MSKKKPTEKQLAYWKSQKENIWSKGLTKEDPRIAKFVGAVTGENNRLWKGDNVGYKALHGWVIRKLGKAQKCAWCGRTREEGKIEWASISHKAKRDLNDYISLCSRCHHIYDGIDMTSKNTQFKSLSVEYKGVKKTLKEWSEILGIKKSTLTTRINRFHWDIHKAFTTKVSKVINGRVCSKEMEVKLNEIINTIKK